MTVAVLQSETSRDPRDLSGPRRLPIVGNLLEIRRDPLNYFVRTSRDYGDVIPIHMGIERILMINNPEYIKYVLQDNHRNYRKSKFYGKLRPILGDGMLLSEGETWLRVRRVAQPAFRGKCIRGMAVAITNTTAEMLERWNGICQSNKTLDICPEVMRVTLDVVFRALMTAPLGDRSDAVYNALNTVLREAERRVWELTNLSEYLPTRRNRDFRKALTALSEVVHQVISLRRADTAEHCDLLALLMEAYDDPDSPLKSNRQLRDEVMSFVMGGHETTAAALAWTWYLLAKNPAVERRVWDEVDSVLAGRTPTFDDLESLTYTKMVFQETMRLYPPVWTISRTALDDDKIGNHHIPKNTTVMLCPYAIHRNPRFWRHPEEFDPERFSPQGSDGRHQFAFFPFGGGPRACIGSRFALMEGPLVIAMVAQTYRLELIPGQNITPEPTITLRPREGIRVTIKRRNSSFSRPAHRS